MKNVLLNVLTDKLGFNEDIQLKKKIRGLPGISLFELLNALLITDSLEETSKYLGYSIDPVKVCIRKYILPFFPERSKKFGNGGGLASWKYTLLNCIEYKECNQCKEVKHHKDFNKHSGISSGINTICASCQTFSSKNYKCSVDLRKPKWVNDAELLEIYSKCPKGLHVDHIIPLHGELVSGLHVPENLQYLTPSENIGKSNKFIVA